MPVGTKEEFEKAMRKRISIGDKLVLLHDLSNLTKGSIVTVKRIYKPAESFTLYI